MQTSQCISLLGEYEDLSARFNDITYRTNNKEIQGQRNKTTRRTELEATIHVQQLTK